MSTTIDIPVVVVKSISDNKEYEFLQLDNGLSALLVHDPQSKGNPDTKKAAAAALCVNVGSFSDPKDCQGLAHLLEHMLFMGTTKFPHENEYDSFISKHGGFQGGRTDMEYTTYHFSVHQSHLKHALDMFSQFFISPLIKMDSLQRELQAVDSEFALVQQNDDARLQQLKCSTANPLHPYHCFARGNQKSLTDAGDIREKLMSFYKQHYLADRMKLVVIAGEPLKTLRGWVLELFKDIPKAGGLAPRFECDQRPWPVGKLYWVESVKDEHRLVLSWPMPCLDQEYPRKYLAYLISFEGDGSLLNLLKQKNWALMLVAGIGDRSSAGYVFVVDIMLTLLGLTSIFDIICHVYEYVRMLQEQRPQEWIFKERQAIEDECFRFLLEEEDSGFYAATLSRNMHLYPPHHIIYGDYVYDIWDANLIDTLLNHLSPGNMRIDLVSKDFDSNASVVQTEPWFRFPYIVEKIPRNVLGSWTSPLRNTCFHLPMKKVDDPIGSSDFSIKLCSEEQLLDLPFIISEEPSTKVWYKFDRISPKANIIASITCTTDISVRSQVLTDLYIMLLEDDLLLTDIKEMHWEAKVSGLWSVVTGDVYSIRIIAGGYNELLSKHIQLLTELVTKFVAEEDGFQVMKEQLARKYRNANLEPLRHSFSLKSELLEDPCWSSDMKLLVLETLVVEDINNFIPQLFQEVHLETLVQGNLSRKEALNIGNVIKSAVMVKHVPDCLKPRMRMRTVKLPFNKDFVYNASVVNELEENSVADIYFQIKQGLNSKTLRHVVLNDLFEHVVSEPFFNQLRTTEQLGYYLQACTELKNGTLGFCFSIQSSKYSPDYLHERIDAFITRCFNLLKDMSDDIFQKYKASLVTAKLKNVTTLNETLHHWVPIVDGQKLVAEILQDLTKEELIEWYKDYFPNGAPKRRSLAVHVWGCNFKQDTSKQHEYITIGSITALKDNAKFYPRK